MTIPLTILLCINSALILVLATLVLFGFRKRPRGKAKSEQSTKKNTFIKPINIETKSLKTKTISGFFWRFLERSGAQIVTFIVSIILARILDPVVYGTVALVTVFTTILQVFVDSGFGAALIQKKEADNLDFSTVFYFNVVVCTLLYIVMFFCAPLIANFYNSPSLTPLVRVISLTLIISGLKGVQQAYVSRTMQFKKFFYATLGGTLISAVVGIVLAYRGFGVWAIVAQTLTNNFVGTIVLWFTVKWRPMLAFSFKRLKTLFSFGWKLLCSALLNTIYEESRSLIIGKKYSSADLAFYNKGRMFPNLIVSNVNTSIDSVLLPTMSSSQDDREKVKSITRNSIRVGSYLMWPLMVGLGVCAEPFVRLVLTDKWAFCVPYLQIFCFIYALMPLQTANLNAMKAMGRSDLFLGLEVVKKLLGILAIVISMWFGVFWIAFSACITSFLCTVINAFPNKKLLNYSWIEQIKDIFASMLLAIFMGVIVYMINFLPLGNLLKLLIQVPLGVAVYILLSILIKYEPFYYVFDILKKFLKKEKTIKTESKK